MTEKKECDMLQKITSYEANIIQQALFKEHTGVTNTFTCTLSDAV